MAQNISTGSSSNGSSTTTAYIIAVYAFENAAENVHSTAETNVLGDHVSMGLRESGVRNGNTASAPMMHHVRVASDFQRLVRPWMTTKPSNQGSTTIANVSSVLSGIDIAGCMELFLVCECGALAVLVQCSL